jgi:hypothetical protein
MLGLKSNGPNDSVGSPITVGVYRNNIAYGGNLVLNNMYTTADDADNSWTMTGSPTGSDFLSLDTTGVFGPRDADGSMPNFKMMHLAKTSQYAGAGVDVGFGAKPDLGAFPTTTSASITPQTANPTERSWLFRTGSAGTMELITNLSWPAQLRVEIVDAAGHPTRILCEVPAGEHAAVLQTPPLGPGIHFARIIGPDFSGTQAIVVR